MPGNCNGKRSCEEYCAQDSHIEECLVFAEQAQLLPADEIKEAKKVMGFIKAGETPGKCKTKDSCREYCSKDENFEECILFAEKANLISAEEAAMAHKVGGKGPGGCKGKNDCLAYCEKEENVEECAKFAVKKDLVSKEEKELIQTGTLKIKEGLEKLPPDARPLVERCLIGLMGADKLAKIKGGENLSLTKKQGDGAGNCFESVMANYASQKEGGVKERTTPPLNPPSSIPPSFPENQSNNPTGEQIPTQIPTVDCSSFANVPNCSLVGNPDSMAYKLCKQCFPDK